MHGLFAICNANTNLSTYCLKLGEKNYYQQSISRVSMYIVSVKVRAPHLYAAGFS